MLDQAIKQQIKHNVRTIRNNLKSHPEVLLLAATKTIDAERIRYAVEECGITAIGENRVNELLEKYEHYPAGAELHFIGRLQKNKVKYLVGKVALIHSVDSLALGEEISRRSLSKGIVSDILLEVNIANEPSKGGAAPDEVFDLFFKLRELEGIKIRGLMAIPPAITNNPDKISDNIDYFKEMKKIFDEINEKILDISVKNVDNSIMDILSMGMSGDYMQAVENGSNLIRLGTAVFGERSYKI